MNKQQALFQQLAVTDFSMGDTELVSKLFGFSAVFALNSKLTMYYEYPELPRDLKNTLQN